MLFIFGNFDRNRSFSIRRGLIIKFTTGYTLNWFSDLTYFRFQIVIIVLWAAGSWIRRSSSVWERRAGWIDLNFWKILCVILDTILIIWIWRTLHVYFWLLLRPCSVLFLLRILIRPFKCRCLVIFHIYL
jgi:hypothetical protein